MKTKFNVFDIENSQNKLINKKNTKIALILFIVLYPLISTFYGIDLGDTGYHLFFFENAFSNPDKISFTAYMSTVFGWCWNNVFGFLGLWGFNFFEVLIEWLAIWVVFKTFKKTLGEIPLLIGLCFGVIGTGTYLNVFNYHQFHVTLLTLMYCAMYKACTEKKLKYSLFAGIWFALDVFARVGSIAAIASLAVYIYWAAENKEGIKYTIKHIGMFLLGFLSASLVAVISLLATNQFMLFYNNIFRLSDLATDSDTGYNITSLFDKLIFDSLDTVATGFIFIAAVMVLLLACSYFFNKYEHGGRKFIAYVIGIVGIYVATYMMKYAYTVNQAENWPQMTTGPRFILGICLTLAFFIFAYYAFGPKRELSLTAILGCLLMVFTIAGSNTGTKHIVLALWIIMPLCIYVILELGKWLTCDKNLDLINKTLSLTGVQLKKGGVYMTFFILIFMYTIKFAHMAYYTCNFDATNRLTLTASVDSDRLKWLKTTERQAEAMNGVIKAMEEVDEELPLMVYGSSLIYYYVLERESYIEPWVSSSNNTAEALAESLENEAAKEGELPAIVYCRTAHAYGFNQAEYDNLLSIEFRSDNLGKKDILIEMLRENNYELVMENDYYMVMIPGGEDVDQEYINKMK